VVKIIGHKAASPQPRTERSVVFARYIPVYTGIHSSLGPHVSDSKTASRSAKTNNVGLNERKIYTGWLQKLYIFQLHTISLESFKIK